MSLEWQLIKTNDLWTLFSQSVYTNNIFINTQLFNYHINVYII